MVFDGDFNTGAYASWGPTVATRVPVHASGPYFTPNYRASARAIHTNGPVSGAFRGFGVPQAAYMQETLYDELADRLEIDRLDFRLKNALRNGQPTVCGDVMDEGIGISACLEELQPLWTRALAEADRQNRADSVVRRGVGVASCWYGCGNTGIPNPSTMKLGITPDGRPGAAPGRCRYRAGLQHRHPADLRGGAGNAARSFRVRRRRYGTHPRCRQDLRLAPDLHLRQGRRKIRTALRETLLRHANVSDQAHIALEGAN